jgi:hypothetical protein
MHFRTFDAQIYINRRQVLRSKVESGIILLMGNRMQAWLMKSILKMPLQH